MSSAGVVIVLGYVSGRLHSGSKRCHRKAAWFPHHWQKIYATRKIAMENQIYIYLVDSAGVYLPMQDEIFPGQGAFWTNIQVVNAGYLPWLFPKIAAAMGSCVLQVAAIVIMSDEALMSKRHGSIFSLQVPIWSKLNW